MKNLGLKETSTALFFTVLAELFAGGGGRMLSWGPVSLRMVLFTCALGVTIVYFAKGYRLAPAYVRLLLFFFITILVGVLAGVAHGSARSLWWEDLKPLLYFLLLPFFYFTTRDDSVPKKIGNLLAYNSLLLTALFFLLLLLLQTKLIPFLSFYHAVIGTEEFFFRGEITFFYKGFLYLSIGFIFLHFTRKSKWLLLPLAVALLLTVTRGFWFALLLTYALIFFQTLRGLPRVLCVTASLILAVGVLWKGQTMISYISQSIDLHQKSEQSTPIPTDSLAAMELNPRLLGDRAHSDDARWRQITQVLREVDFASLLIGHGFGQGTALRPIHMEISYLEIFHKQGLAGLAFWCYLFYEIYRRFRESNQNNLSMAFYYSALFVFIQSTTNQYVNNPIGLGMILLSLVCLDRTSKGSYVN